MAYFYGKNYDEKFLDHLDKRVLGVMEKHDIEDTPMNRYKALYVIKKIWDEAPPPKVQPIPGEPDMIEEAIEQRLTDYAFAIFEME